MIFQMHFASCEYALEIYKMGKIHNYIRNEANLNR